MKKKIYQYAFRVELRDRQNFKELCHKQGTTMAAVCRYFISEYLERHSKRRRAH